MEGGPISVISNTRSPASRALSLKAVINLPLASLPNAATRDFFPGAGIIECRGAASGFIKHLRTARTGLLRVQVAEAWGVHITLQLQNERSIVAQAGREGA